MIPIYKFNINGNSEFAHIHSVDTFGYNLIFDRSIKNIGNMIKISFVNFLQKAKKVDIPIGNYVVYKNRNNEYALDIPNEQYNFMLVMRKNSSLVFIRDIIPLEKYQQELKKGDEVCISFYADYLSNKNTSNGIILKRVNDRVFILEIIDRNHIRFYCGNVKDLIPVNKNIPTFNEKSNKYSLDIDRVLNENFSDGMVSVDMNKVIFIETSYHQEIKMLKFIGVFFVISLSIYIIFKIRLNRII